MAPKAVLISAADSGSRGWRNLDVATAPATLLPAIAASGSEPAASRQSSEQLTAKDRHHRFPMPAPWAIAMNNSMFYEFELPENSLQNTSVSQQLIPIGQPGVGSLQWIGQSDGRWL
jgi:hypothetical protein